MTLESLESIYNNNFKKIYKFFYFKVFDQQTAEDLSSDAFLGFAEYIKNGKEIENSEALLYRIAVNTFNKYLKRKYSEVQIEDSEINETTTINHFDEIKDDNTFVKFVGKYIDRLPNKQKSVLRKRLIEKKSLKLICEELGKDMNYVKTTQKRGIKNLKEMLEKSD